MRAWSRAAFICFLIIVWGAATAMATGGEPPATLAPPSQALPTATPAPVITRPYALGDSGEDVYAFKERMQFLGYFKQGISLSNAVSDVTLERVNQLLTDNGMAAVTVISTEVQEMIFTRDDFAIIPTPAPIPTPGPLIAPAGTPELPALDGEGFLLDADGEFVYADDDDGLWYYISHDLYVNIRRYNDMEAQNVWFEAEVKTRGAERLLSFLTGTLFTYRTPVALARENGAVLAFTDDFFAKRNYGVAVRDGEVYRDYIRVSSKSYPLGDTLAVFADGTMRAYDYNEYTAEEFLEMGAAHVLSFGPWLIKNGEINPRVLPDTYMHYHEPRLAIGMIAPGHYVVLAADGRYDGADGVYIGWLAGRMREIGVTEAINLDGGGTTALVFMGTQLSRVSAAQPDGANTRRVSSMLGFGVSEAVPEP
ncbi:MAG: phosphodiester glycosidase family protein [Bacillota bacterium]